MKRNLLGLFAVVLAIAVSSFTVSRVQYFYLVYDGTGSQTSTGNYLSLTNQVEPNDISGGATILNWFRVTDSNNNGIDGSEFIDSFEFYDVVNDDDNTLNDETAEIDHELDLKNL